MTIDVRNIPPDIILWLDDELECLHHGEAGFTLIIQDGKIRKYRKIVNVDITHLDKSYKKHYVKKVDQ